MQAALSCAANDHVVTRELRARDVTVRQMSGSGDALLVDTATLQSYTSTLVFESRVYFEFELTGLEGAELLSLAMNTQNATVVVVTLLLANGAATREVVSPLVELLFTALE